MTHKKQQQGVLLIGGFVVTCVCGESLERPGNQWAKTQTRNQVEQILQGKDWQHCPRFGWKCPKCVEHDNRGKQEGRG